MSHEKQITDEILALFSGPAGQVSYGEGVTQLQHALQCAKFASDVTDDEETIIAALLHDIGHVCDETAEHMGEVGVVDHEGIGADFLRQRGFSEKVAQLVAGHVTAKRYLITTNPKYELSAASAETLQHQGGKMTPQEIQAFEQDPLFRAKLRMRFWDEMGKRSQLEMPGLSFYRAMIMRHLQRQAVEVQPTPPKVSHAQ